MATLTGIAFFPYTSSVILSMFCLFLDSSRPYAHSCPCIHLASSFRKRPSTSPPPPSYLSQCLALSVAGACPPVPGEPLHPCSCAPEKLLELRSDGIGFDSHLPLIGCVMLASYLTSLSPPFLTSTARVVITTGLHCGEASYMR